jgi:hypothetical protein
MRDWRFVSSDRQSSLCLLTGLLVLASPPSVQPPAQPAAPPPPPPQAVAAPAPRVFGSDTGLVLNFIKPDKTADFEAVVDKLKEALRKSADPQRQQQAASWRVFKSQEPAAGGAALYVYIVDPPVKGADYSVATILAEAFTADELSRLLKQYVDAYASGQNLVNLSLVSDLAK